MVRQQEHFRLTVEKLALLSMLIMSIVHHRFMDRLTVHAPEVGHLLKTQGMHASLFSWMSQSVALLHTQKEVEGLTKSDWTFLGQIP